MSVRNKRLLIALYIDADISVELARQLRKHHYDAVSALESGKHKLNDQEQLNCAIADRRAILTFNKRHFEPLFEEYWNSGREHYGIIVSEQLPLGELLRRTLRLLDSISADEMKNNFKDLGEFVER